ncbi:MAG: peptidylprolyl isomerase [Hyperthermus sp.]|nr:MAG: peptidylprolyl isomerase [Hyperthermus sp.]
MVPQKRGVETGMTLQEGEFALVEYTLKVKETGEIIETTDRDEAKKANIYDEKERYGPRLIIVGEKRVIPGIEEAIRQLNEGEEKEVVIPPEKGFGKRDQQKIKIIPKTQFIKNGIVPEPGKIVEINGKLATIRAITGGRVIVDFNHPLSGKTLWARVKLVKILKTPPEKLQHLLLRRLPSQIGVDDVKVEYDAKEKYARIVFNEKSLLVPEMQTIRRIVVGEIAKYMRPEVDKIDFIDHVEYGSKKGEKEEASTQQA